MVKKIERIKKREGNIVEFKQEKITIAITKAFNAIGRPDAKLAQEISDKVSDVLKRRFKTDEVPNIEQVQDVIEEILILDDLTDVAKAYILYREQRRKLRELGERDGGSVDYVDDYLEKLDWEVKENANMAYSLQGLNHYVSTHVMKRYWREKVYPKEIRQASESGDFHLHNLDTLGPYCMGWDLYDFLLKGFRGVKGKVESKPPKHFGSALGQIVNFLYTMQGECAGAVAFSNFDTLLAPFIRYDGLSYPQVKQALQEFMFNMAVPTRVGFQCMSEDTEILTENGWAKYNEVKEGSVIATFNTESQALQYLPVRKMFVREYKGKMYNLKNRISDQLISPEHRIVRKKFNTNNYTLETIETAMKLKTDLLVPIGSYGNVSGESEYDQDLIMFLAWVISEGSIDKNGRGVGRISIYQSEKVNKVKYDEIISLCNSLKFEYSITTQKGLGEECNVIRFDSESSKKILGYFDSDKYQGIKFIPDFILNSDTETARIFIETYIKGDGHEGCKIVTTSEEIRDDLMHLISNAGYGCTMHKRNLFSEISKKDQYIIRIIRHKDTYITNITEVDYNGTIWCPNTKNETVIARRNGKVFITGNCPFTNITLDIKPGAAFSDEAIIIGGKLQEETYSEFEEEMKIFNKALYQCILEGDASGRPFTFPIPTINITKDFDWDSKDLDLVWEATAKYGINYFANYINSEMDPKDVRSMCCRLRLNLKELNNRGGGGLFGAGALTGSIGVVTINLPKIGHLSKTRKEYFQRLQRAMDLAKSSLEIKRKILESFISKGLYPYSKFYLAGVKKGKGSYFANHFSTIGLIGMNESLLNFLGDDIGARRGKKFALEVMDYMREQLVKYQEDTQHIYNLEATPGEGTSYRFGRNDKKAMPEIITAGTKQVPYYTNSSLLPVNYSDDIFEVLKLQDELQCKYTGGTVLHIYTGEKLTDIESIKDLVKKIFTKFELPYISITPTFSICPVHGYIAGEHKNCPQCVIEQPCEVYSRVVGYLRPVSQWNEGKQKEHEERKAFKIGKREEVKK